MRQLTNKFEQIHESGMGIMQNSKQQKILQSIEDFVHCMESPLQRMEHNLAIWVSSFLIIPIFALANAGIPIDMGNHWPDLGTSRNFRSYKRTDWR